jgi:hypothetical protein
MKRHLLNTLSVGCSCRGWASRCCGCSYVIRDSVSSAWPGHEASIHSLGGQFVVVEEPAGPAPATAEVPLDAAGGRDPLRRQRPRGERTLTSAATRRPHLALPAMAVGDCRRLVPAVGVVRRRARIVAGRAARAGTTAPRRGGARSAAWCRCAVAGKAIAVRACARAPRPIGQALNGGGALPAASHSPGSVVVGRVVLGLGFVHSWKASWQSTGGRVASDARAGRLRRRIRALEMAHARRVPGRARGSTPAAGATPGLFRSAASRSRCQSRSVISGRVDHVLTDPGGQRRGPPLVRGHDDSLRPARRATPPKRSRRVAARSNWPRIPVEERAGS